MAHNEGEYIIFGDFNAVRHKDERWGCMFSQREADDNSFITDTTLKEVDMGGFAYTRVSSNGEKNE